jgi:hypothetical protein
MAKGKNTDKFKIEGKAILNGKKPLPNSVKDFIRDAAGAPDQLGGMYKTTNTHLHDSRKPQPPKSTKGQNQDLSTPDAEPLGRLHIEIRQDLMDELLGMVFQRKRDPYIKGRAATQRGIIEEALQHYFETRIK